MYNKILDVVSQLTKDSAKAEKAAKEIFAIVQANKKAGKASNPDIVKDGVTYKFCTWSKVYHAEADMVKGKAYSKAAYRIWDRFYKDAKKMKTDAAMKLMHGEIDATEAKRLCSQADELDARKDMTESYSEVAALGYSAEELR